jgi:hypothetical protein
MTETRENNVEHPELNRAVDDSGIAAEKLAAGVPQGQRSADGSLSESTRRIIIAATKPSRGYRPSRGALVVVGVILAGFVLFQITYHLCDPIGPAEVTAQSARQPQEPLTSAYNGSPQKEAPILPDAPGALMNIRIDTQTAETLDKAVSIQTARLLYQRQDYKEAYYVYDKLRANVTGNGLRQQCLRDWLGLQMALSVQKTTDQALMGPLFTEALQSRSLVVRAMANYHLAFIQNRHQQL